VHRAPEFYASLLNNQPMGFYTPATIVKDAQRHGVKIQPVCVMKSDWRCTVVNDNTFRLGFCVVNGLRQEHGEQIVRQRLATASVAAATGPDRSAKGRIRGGEQFDSLDDFKRRVSLSKEELRTLAELGALNCFAKHRRAAMWKVEETIHDDLVRGASRTGVGLAVEDADSAASPLLPMTMPERVRADYETMNLTAGPHPMKLLRDRLPQIWRAIDLSKAKHGANVQIAGNVICRQRP